MSTRILSAFNPLKRVGFAVLLYAHCAFAQPYEPTYLLDVTGGYQDWQSPGLVIRIVLTSVVMPTNSSLRIYWGNNLSTSDFLDFGRFDSTGREIGWQDASFDAGFTVPAGDVDGDGYADIMRTLCVWYDAQCHLYPCLFLGGPGVFDTLADWVGDLTTMRFTTNVGDYNGDGRDDYTSRPLSAQYFGLYFGQEPPLSQEYEWEHTPNRNHMGFGDVNGDGFSDFGMSYFMGSVGIARTEIFLGSTEADSVADVVIERSTGDNERNGRIVGDLNGDGFDDVLTHFSSWSEGQRWLLYYGGIEMDTEIDDELVWGDGIGAEYVTPLGDINADAFDDYAFYENNEGLDINHIEVWLGATVTHRTCVDS
ncbi:MAG: VCBS repeat-containing protein [bacterium]|nr:VCBS repeat-containing protein [bacterium]